jgi:actin-like ATPase involved in cell morphogenesis
VTYHLGIDIGTTYTAAATAATAEGGRAEPVRLGSRGTKVPSVAAIDGTDLVVGEPAERIGASDPSALAREFKRRVGDPTPILLAGSPVAAELLMARLASWVVAEASRQRGAPPGSVTATHPANWGEFKLDLFRQALRHVGVTVHGFVPEPVAAATAYASQRDLADGDLLAVYDLGGGTFDAAVVQAAGGAFRIVGRPGGVERLGGMDFDYAVFHHVLDAIGVDPEAVDPDEPSDPATALAMARLHAACVAAKEALSVETEVTVPVVLPDRHTELRLGRADLEGMVRPGLTETVAVLHRTVTDAGVAVDDLRAVLLVGGSSRIPLVSELVREEMRRPVVVDAHPKDTISIGAALATRTSAAAAEPPSPSSPPSPAPAPAPVPRRRRRVALAGGVVLAVAAAALALVIGGGGDDDETGGSTGSEAEAGASSTTTNPADGPEPTVPPDPELEAALVGLDDLPDGWSEAEESTGDGGETGPLLCGTEGAEGVPSPSDATGWAAAAFERTEPFGWLGHEIIHYPSDVAADFVDQAVASAGACEAWTEEAGGTDGQPGAHITSVPEQISGPRLGDESAWVGSRSTWEWVDDPTMDPTNLEMISLAVRQGDTITTVTVLSLDPVAPGDRTLVQELAETLISQPEAQR